MANVVFVSGLLAADEGYDALWSEPDRSWLLEKARFGLAYLTHGHVTGGGACADGASWGGVWQSAWWTTRMALGAKLIWYSLRLDLQGSSFSSFWMMEKSITWSKATACEIRFIFR